MDYAFIDIYHKKFRKMKNVWINAHIAIPSKNTPKSNRVKTKKPVTGIKSEEIVKNN